jgi:c-di-GMP-binding flagellar brake protein YcgR
VDPAAPIRVDIMGQGFLEVLAARDISVGGLGIRVPHGFEGCDIEGEVELIVTLGRARPFKARGAIRHASQSGSDQVFGVEFTKLAPEQRQAIENYIQTCRKRRSAPGFPAARPPGRAWRSSGTP